MKNKFLLHVISGKYRGRGLCSPPDFSVRPTTGRVKGSLFDIIRTSVFGCSFLDVFAGTGQIGIEALSVGAKSVTFVDGNTDIVLKNISLLNIGSEAKAIRGDFTRVLPTLEKESFDFVFADPPYKEGLYERIIELSLPLVKENGRLILEHSSDFTVNACDGFENESVRIYGSRGFTILKKVYGGER